MPFEVVTNTPSILDFAKHVLGVELNLKMWSCGDTKVWFSVKEIQTLFMISAANLSRLVQQNPDEFAMVDGTQILSDDAIMEIIFEHRNPLTQAFRKFIKYVLKELFTKKVVHLEDAKKDHGVDLTDAKSQLEAQRRKIMFEIEMKEYLIQDYMRLKAPTDTVYLNALESQYLVPVTIWILDYRSVMSNVDLDDEEIEIPEYDYILLETYIECFMKIGGTRPRNGIYLTTVYAKNTRHVRHFAKHVSGKIYSGVAEDIIDKVKSSFVIRTKRGLTM